MPFTAKSLPQVVGKFNTELRAMDARRDGEWYVKNRRCAVCWGLLALRFREGTGWVVECSQYGEEHYGNVSAYWAERRLAESELESREVLESYAGMLGIRRDNKLTRAQASAALYGE